MAVAAEVLEQNDTTGELYAYSLRNIRAMGALASCSAIGSPEYIDTEAEVYSDFVTALGENLATDPQFGEHLYFDRMKEFEVVDKKVVDDTGRPIKKLVFDGWIKAKETAITDPRMDVEADRAEGDLITAGIVDGLTEGEMYAVISYEPKKELEQDPDFWSNKMNYRKGMAVAQVYYRLKNGNILAGAYAIKKSDLEAGRQMLADEGVIVPENESANRMIRYGIRKSLDEETARGFGHILRKKHAELIKKPAPSLSVTEFINSNDGMVRSYFKAYMKPLSQACDSGLNNQTMRSLALLMHSSLSHKLDESGRRQLLKVSNARNFDDNDARFMENCIRYGLVEILRARLPFVRNTENNVGEPDRREVQVAISASYIPIEAMNTQLVGAIVTGVENKRSYGGCSGASLSVENNDLNSLPGQQDIFGGKLGDEKKDMDKKENWVWKKGICIVEKCPTRPGETEVGPCDVCHCCQNWFDKGYTLDKIARIYRGLSSVTKSTIKKSDKHKQTTVKKGKAE